jgi:alkyl hydroperoxide reductase subunit AhpF
MKRERFTALVLGASLFCAMTACGPKSSTPYRGLGEKDRNQVKEQLANMRDPVELVSFTGNDAAGRQAAGLYDEISALQPKVSRKAYTLEGNRAEARELGISLAPAVVIRKGTLTGLRFYGVPEGYEFPAFLEAIDRLSRDAPALSARTVGTLADLRVPIDFKVFTTPS